MTAHNPDNKALIVIRQSAMMPSLQLPVCAPTCCMSMCSSVHHRSILCVFWIQDSVLVLCICSSGSNLPDKIWRTNLNAHCGLFNEKINNRFYFNSSLQRDLEIQTTNFECFCFLLQSVSIKLFMSASFSFLSLYVETYELNISWDVDCISVLAWATTCHEAVFTNVSCSPK